MSWKSMTDLADEDTAALRDEIERLRATRAAGRPYVFKRADSLGSDWAAMEVLKLLDEQLAK